jgi:GNAT superfamily N-acetyltransferase
MDIGCEWRGNFDNGEVNALHAEAFETRVYSDTEWNWRDQTARHSLGWVTARDGELLVGFVNVPWDGFVHAWVQDTMVARSHRHHGIGRQLVETATEGARAAGCEWLHVDFEATLAPFYVDVCGFTPASAGLIALK